jgi:hypothetical protein
MLGSPPSRKAIVRLERLCENCGDRRTRHRMALFCSKLRACFAASADKVSTLTGKASSVSRARASSVGGRNSKNLSIVLSSVESIRGIVEAGVRRSASVVKRLP